MSEFGICTFCDEFATCRISKIATCPDHLDRAVEAANDRRRDRRQQVVTPLEDEDE